MKDEILDKALPSDTAVIPRYDVLDANGNVAVANAQLKLKNPILQEGTPLNRDSMLKDTTAQALGLPNTATPDDGVQRLSELARLVKNQYGTDGSIITEDTILLSPNEIYSTNVGKLYDNVKDCVQETEHYVFMVAKARYDASSRAPLAIYRLHKDTRVLDLLYIEYKTTSSPYTNIESISCGSKDTLYVEVGYLDNEHRAIFKLTPTDTIVYNPILLFTIDFGQIEQVNVLGIDDNVLCLYYRYANKASTLQLYYNATRMYECTNDIGNVYTTNIWHDSTYIYFLVVENGIYILKRLNSIKNPADAIIETILPLTNKSIIRTQFTYYIASVTAKDNYAYVYTGISRQENSTIVEQTNEIIHIVDLISFTKLSEYDSGTLSRVAGSQTAIPSTRLGYYCDRIHLYVSQIRGGTTFEVSKDKKHITRMSADTFYPSIDTSMLSLSFSGNHLPFMLKSVDEIYTLSGELLVKLTDKDTPMWYRRISMLSNPRAYKYEFFSSKLILGVYLSNTQNIYTIGDASILKLSAFRQINWGL